MSYPHRVNDLVREPLLLLLNKLPREVPTDGEAYHNQVPVPFGQANVVVDAETGIPVQTCATEGVGHQEIWVPCPRPSAPTAPAATAAAALVRPEGQRP